MANDPSDEQLALIRTLPSVDGEMQFDKQMFNEYVS
mgnify:CR=1 FL=1